MKCSAQKRNTYAAAQLERTTDLSKESNGILAQEQYPREAVFQFLVQWLADITATVVRRTCLQVMS